MTILDTVIEILSRTSDGELLTPPDLALTQYAANDGLTEAGEVRLAQLHADVLSGEYFKQAKWFRGVEHMTQNHEGYVFWKGKRVEHYSYRDDKDSRDRELASLQRLAESCKHVESLGLPVTSRNALSLTLRDAELGSPWLLAAQRYYSFFHRNGAVIGIFNRTKLQADSDSCVFSVERLADGTHRVLNHPGAYEAFHAIQDSGAESLSCEPAWAELVTRLTTLGMSAEALDLEINK